ncbi:MAG TPA: glycosyl hydrolase, partial [Thermoanaerobaculia bacterium]|nr:glycosyl hydrolase [Thermoanaerobaculia bacterium]
MRRDAGRLSLFLAIVLALAPARAGLAAVDPASLQALRYRMLGPSRGGRSTAVAGVPSEPRTFYLGTSGGLWKTTNAGASWFNVSDAFFQSGSIGAVAVADADPNVVYAGTGQACLRGNVSAGVGIYKSTDSGKTWRHSGLGDVGQIARIRVHPRDPNLVYVAAVGRAFGPSAARGVFRSKDGGQTWEKVLYVSSRTGATDLAMDATNPRVLHAAAWTGERKPWTIVSGSAESGLYKSVDGGDHWKKLGGGLPEGVVGKIGVAVSPVDADRVWALVEASEGGLYRSDDAGETWRLLRTNARRRLFQRTWYYQHVFADPRDANRVYVLNVDSFKSEDGGKSFEPIERLPHGDSHDLWINPNDNAVMILGNDGGGTVSVDGGKTWST